MKDEGWRIVDAEEEMCTISIVLIRPSAVTKMKPCSFIWIFVNIPGAEMVFVLTVVQGAEGILMSI